MEIRLRVVRAIGVGRAAASAAAGVGLVAPRARLVAAIRGLVAAHHDRLALPRSRALRVGARRIAADPAHLGAVVVALLQADVLLGPLRIWRALAVVVLRASAAPAGLGRVGAVARVGA